MSLPSCVVVSLDAYRARRFPTPAFNRAHSLVSIDCDLAEVEESLSFATQRRDRHERGSRLWFRAHRLVAALRSEWWEPQLERNEILRIGREADRG